MNQRVISWCIAIALLFAMLPSSAFIADAAEIMESGTCGSNLRWTLDESGVLVISGSGPMTDFFSVDAPWSDYQDAIKSVNIEKGVTTIGMCAFTWCTNLVSVVIPNSVSSIGQNAFQCCESLIEVEIPDSVTFIDNNAFAGCDSLTGIKVDKNNPSFSNDGAGVLFDKHKTVLIRAPGGLSGAYTIPDSVTTIGFSAFTSCNAMANVTIPDSVTEIGGCAFENCRNLVSVTIPNSVKIISYLAFHYCNNLINVTIPDSVVEIGWSAFESCHSLTRVDIPASVTAIGLSAFRDCSSLTGIYVDGANPNYSSDDHGFLFDKQKTQLIQAAGGISGTYAIANGVVTIGEDAFYDCGNLTGVTIPDSVTTIGEGAFGFCSKLTGVTIPDSVTTIGETAFIHCWDLSSVTIGTGVTSIGPSAFQYCGVLETVAFRGSAPAIGRDAFYDDETTVYYPAADLSWTADVMQDYGGTLTWEPYDPSQMNDPANFENYARTEWIDRHIEYANSDRYQQQVVQGFSGALDDALEDIKDNGMIKAYNTLDSINTVLAFDLDLTDVEEYELLLAQILFSRTGAASIDEIYDEYLSSNLISVCEILVNNIPEMTSSEVSQKVEQLKELLDTIKTLSRSDSRYNEVLNQIMDSVSSFDDLNFGKELAEAFDKAGLGFAADFLASEIETVEGTLSEVVIYMAAGEAYCNTSDAFGDMILALRRHIAVPSDYPMFQPYPSDELLVNDRMIWTRLGLKNADNAISPDPLNTPIYLSALAKAIERYYTQLEAAKAGNADVIAQNAMAEFVADTADNLIDADLNVVVSLFECLPVVKHFSEVRDFFDGTQFVIDTFTGIDDRAYLGTMVMRLYGIAYIHYLSVDRLAAHTNSWGTRINSSSILPAVDVDVQFEDASLFDEAVAVYRAILSVAADYAVEYYTTYYEASGSILPKYPKYDPPIPPYVDRGSDTFKSVKQKIFELQMQKTDLAYEWCHSAKTIFNQLHGVKTFGSSDMLIYSFKCPVSVTVRNESGEAIAVLSNGGSMVPKGCEQYFFTSEIISGSGEYVKIAAVPRTYAVVIEGTGTGRMDVSVSEYTDGRLGDTKQYFGVPVSGDSEGYFGENEESGEDFCLIMDGTVYAEGDYSNMPLKDGNGVVLYIAVAAIVVVCAGLAAIILKCRKSRK